MKLKLSKDRKVTNAVMPSGKQARIANTFGLPSGRKYSCPGATGVCSRICYAGKLEKLFPSMMVNLLHNWNLVNGATFETLVTLLGGMIEEFRGQCEKHNAEKLFRIHFDGDFFNEEYTRAWRTIIKSNSDVHFWAYTRSDFAVPMLINIDNLSLYFSTDSDNAAIAKRLHEMYNVKLAFLGADFSTAQSGIKDLIGVGGVKCPENNKKIPLISTKGSACVSCGLCIKNRNNVLFSISKKKG